MEILQKTLEDLQDRQRETKIFTGRAGYELFCDAVTKAGEQIFEPNKFVIESDPETDIQRFFQK